MRALLLLPLFIFLSTSVFAAKIESNTQEEPSLLRYTEENEKETVRIDRDTITIEGHYTEAEKRMNKAQHLDRFYENMNPGEKRAPEHVPYPTSEQTERPDGMLGKIDRMLDIFEKRSEELEKRSQMHLEEAEGQNLERRYVAPAKPSSVTGKGSWTVSKEWSENHTR